MCLAVKLIEFYGFTEEVGKIGFLQGQGNRVATFDATDIQEIINDAIEGVSSI